MPSLIPAAGTPLDTLPPTARIDPLALNPQDMADFAHQVKQNEVRTEVVAGVVKSVCSAIMKLLG